MRISQNSLSHNQVRLDYLHSYFLIGGLSQARLYWVFLRQPLFKHIGNLDTWRHWSLGCWALRRFRHLVAGHLVNWELRRLALRHTITFLIHNISKYHMNTNISCGYKHIMCTNSSQTTKLFYEYKHRYKVIIYVQTAVFPRMTGHLFA